MKQKTRRFCPWRLKEEGRFSRLRRLEREGEELKRRSGDENLRGGSTYEDTRARQRIGADENKRKKAGGEEHSPSLEHQERVLRPHILLFKRLLRACRNCSG